jgi:hypothetical protein
MQSWKFRWKKEQKTINMKIYWILITGLLFFIAGCGSAQSATNTATATWEPVKTIEVALPTQTSQTNPLILSTKPQNPKIDVPTMIPVRKEPTEADLVSPTEKPQPLPTLGPDDWKKLPVIPTISDNVIQIYQRGLAMGNNPHSFSKIGDCGGTPAWFLGDFDRGPEFYRLGEYSGLEEVIQYYQGSYARTSLAAKSGFNASSILTSLWADHSICQKDETPLACEYRENRPIIAIIALGTNDVYHPDKFEPQMRKIIEYSIENGVIPILATKADNLEGDNSINATIARLAQEYDIPMWNYWRAVQSLPNQGLQDDGAHLTWARSFFDDKYAMESGWTIRNLTALQILDAVWRAVHQGE